MSERTFGWRSRYRRSSRDYERKVQTSETFIEVAMIRLLLARFTKHAYHPIGCFSTPGSSPGESADGWGGRDQPSLRSPGFLVPSALCS